MKAKGTTINSIKAFVKENFPAFYDEWLERLPSESRKIFSDEILSGEWYPMYEAAILPVRQLGDMFFDGNREEAFYEIGVFSGKRYLVQSAVYDDVLKGVDKTTAATYVASFYNLFFSEGFMKTYQTKNTIVFEYHNHPKCVLENLARTAGYLEVIFQQIKTPPNKVDWSYRKGENGKYIGVNTVYFD
jgi:hypothetical protein